MKSLTERDAWQELLATPASELPMSVVDVETTGLTPPRDRICEVAVVHFNGQHEAARFVSLINPGRAISPGAAAVNGITEGMVRDAPRFEAVAGEVRALLAAGVVVAHNAPFDLGFLAHELRESGLPLPDTPVLDTLALARRCFAFQSNSLGNVSARLGIVGGGHRALADALTTHAVLGRFVHLLGGKRLTLAALLERQGRSIPWPIIAPLPALSFSSDLEEAVRGGHRLRLSYRSAAGAPTERLVDPIELVAQRGGDYLVAFCHLRQEQRTFRIDRIDRWELS